MGECLVQRGWDVEYVGNGGFSVETPPEQLEAYRADDAACAEAAGVGTARAAPITEALAVSEYAAQQRLRACLVELGIDPPELPTYQVFSDALFERAEAIELYGLAANRGDSFVDDPDVRRSCPDPMDTWGYNRAGE